MARSSSGNYENPRDYNIADPLAFSKSFESTFESTFKEGMNYYNNKIQALQQRDDRLKNTANEMAKLGEAAIKSGKATREQVEASINNFLKENKKFKYNKKGERSDFIAYTEADSGESINDFNGEIGGINDFLGFTFSEEGLNFRKTANASDPEHAQLLDLMNEQIKNQNAVSFGFGEDGFKGGAKYKDPVTGEEINLSSSDLSRIVSSTAGTQERRKNIEESYKKIIDATEDRINTNIENLVETNEFGNITKYVDADKAGGVIDQQVENMIARQPIEDLQDYYNNNSNLTKVQKIKMFEGSSNPIISKLVNRDDNGNLTEESAKNLETLGGLRFLPTDNDRAIKFLKRITGEDISEDQAKAIASEIDLKRLAVTKSVFKQNILDRGILDKSYVRKKDKTSATEARDAKKLKESKSRFERAKKLIAQEGKLPEIPVNPFNPTGIITDEGKRFRAAIAPIITDSGGKLVSFVVSEVTGEPSVRVKYPGVEEKEITLANFRNPDLLTARFEEATGAGTGLIDEYFDINFD